ncbi:MAG: LuxR C-terminal-related transcriptional regulator [Pseudomonadota bacterium]
MNMSTPIALCAPDSWPQFQNKLHLNGFIRSIQTASDRQDVWSTICKHANSVGFEYVTYIDKRSCTTNQKATVFSNLPRWWQEIYLAETYLSEDLIFAHCDDLKPKLLEIYKDDPNYTYSYTEKERRASMHDAGYRSGFVSPNSTNDDAYVSGWCFGCSLDNSNFVELYAQFGAILRIMGFCAHERMKTFRSSRNPSYASIGGLSSREIECLTHLACGKRSPNIAKLMGISLSTVEFHIKGIKKKLEAATREEAVAKAIAEGTIRYTPSN